MDNINTQSTGPGPSDRQAAGPLDVSTFGSLPMAHAEIERLNAALRSQAELLAKVNRELALQSKEMDGQHAELVVLYRELESQQAELTILYRELEAQLGELHTHNDFLNAEVTKRTQAIATQLQELKRVNSILKESDHYKDEFLGVLSHELRTPLNFIMGFASVLEDQLQGALNEQQTLSVARILQGTERMLGLVDNLLDTSSIQAGRFTIAPEMTRCCDLMAEVALQMQPLAELKGIQFQSTCTVTRAVMLDPRRVSQVLVNLIANAFKFTPSGGKVEARMLLDGGDLLAEVMDSGIGIAADNIPLLFTRFKQLDGTPTREAGGTGLGLAISKAIIEVHSGQIGVESELGQGSRFYFRIPEA